MKRGKGVADTAGARCSSCGIQHLFFPTHTHMGRVRFHLHTLGWLHRPGPGWVCERCKVTPASTGPQRAFFTTPGLDKVTR